MRFELFVCSRLYNSAKGRERRSKVGNHSLQLLYNRGDCCYIISSSVTALPILDLDALRTRKSVCPVLFEPVVG